MLSSELLRRLSGVDSKAGMGGAVGRAGVERSERKTGLACATKPDAAVDFEASRSSSRMEGGVPSTSELIMPTNTVRLHRVLRSTPERIYRAFLDAAALAKWLPPNGFTGTVHHLQAEVGGSYRMSFTNFTTGDGHSFGGDYLELVPHERIRYSGKFDDPNLPGVMQTTVSLTQTPFGTELNVVQEGIPEAIPVQACYLGWQESLALLKMLVEAEIRQ
jgi:uncharacterized protein YndB with AHSA1/START domain